MRMRPTVLAVAAAMLSSAAALAFPTTYTVYIVNSTFTQNNPNAIPPTNFPVEPTINIGDTVTWVRINGTHTSRSAAGQDESWDSPNIGAATPFSHTFTRAGSFNYYCEHHGADLGGGQVAGMAAAVHVLPPPPCSSADIGVQGGAPGQDSLLDNNDFIVYIADFFNLVASADIGVQGGNAGQDGFFDNNDFVVFINRFFTDQPLCTG